VARYLLPFLCSVLFIPSTAQAEMSADQKKEIEALVRDYILNNGDVLIESVNKHQQKQEETANKQAMEKAAEFLKTIKDDSNLALAGNPKGDVTLIEFFDYNCGYCKKAFEEIQSLVKDDKNIKIVLYDMPILGPSSLEISKWALASKKQGKYFEYHSALMLHSGEKDEAVLKKLAEDVGMDADKLLKDKADPAIEAEIKKHVETAQSLGFAGTPGFLINTNVFRGYIPYDVMKETIKKERDKAGSKS
jgi:protein-disulfide isomerase